MLSSESTETEVTWSQGEYVPAAEIWQAFQLPGTPLPARGVFANQPSPHTGEPGRPWKPFFLMAAVLLAMMLFFSATARRQTVFQDNFLFQPGAPGEKSFVTRVFDVPGNNGNLKVDLDTDLNNGWAYFAMALINDETGQAYDFGREVSYYYGVDEGESWSEGDKHDDTVLPGIPGGRYYLRVEPEAAPEGAAAPSAYGVPRSIRYQIKLTRDVPYYFRYFLGVILLFLPVLFFGGKGPGFERQRWAESDHGAGRDQLADQQQRGG
jgi:hypothetical protein